MSSGLSSLYKILKDENRQKIIKTLNDKGSVSYTELLEGSEIGSTGLLNYHLKVLGCDLITKNETGKYLLTDKGKIAVSVLLNFPAEATLAQKKRSQKIFWSILAIGQVVILTSLCNLLFSWIGGHRDANSSFHQFCHGHFLSLFRLPDDGDNASSWIR